MIGKINIILLCLAAGSVLADSDALYKRGALLFKSEPAQALELFEQAAGEGNSSAMVGAGYCYETGMGTAVDYAKAIEFYEQAAKLNSLKACEGLARIYASCSDPEFHDGEKAVKYATPVVRKKPRDAEVLALLAAAHARNIEFEKAVQINLKARKYAGRDVASELEKRTTDYKRGIPYPSTSTEDWLMRSATAGSIWAMSRLGHMLSNKESSSYDLDEARSWYARVAEKGYLRVYEEAGDSFFEMAEFALATEYYEKAFNADLYKGLKEFQIPVRVFYRENLNADAERCVEIARSFWGAGYVDSPVDSSLSQEEQRQQPGYGRRWSGGSPEAALLYYEIAALKGSVDAQQFIEGAKDKALCRIAYDKLVKDLDEEALALIEQIDFEKLYKWFHFEICAYIYAEGGNFEKAVVYQEEAVKTIPSLPGLPKRAQKRLENYRAQKAGKSEAKWYYCW